MAKDTNMEKESNHNQLRFKYVFSEDYNPDYANGAYGGVSGSKDIVMHFYNERPALPRETFVEFGDNGESKIVKDTPEVPTIIRYIVSGVTMNLEAAKQLHSWLGGLIDSVENK